jgi:hypothetical protein
MFDCLIMWQALSGLQGVLSVQKDNNVGLFFATSVMDYLEHLTDHFGSALYANLEDRHASLVHSCLQVLLLISEGDRECKIHMLNNDIFAVLTGNESDNLHPLVILLMLWIDLLAVDNLSGQLCAESLFVCSSMCHSYRAAQTLFGGKDGVQLVTKFVQ